jgi:SAM-dependent methyltransferase
MNDLLKRGARQLRRLPAGDALYGALWRAWGQSPGPSQWLRVVMNRETRALVDALGPSGMKALEISGYDWGTPGYFREYRTTSIENYDVCERPIDDTFDIVIAEQVFEHLPRPYRAGRNVHAMLRPGGWFLVTTPFLVRVHEEPLDCTRWTETGMKYLLAECGFELDSIRTGSWGNRECVVANLERWQGYLPKFHSLKNDARFPLAVWALARRT